MTKSRRHATIILVVVAATVAAPPIAAVSSDSTASVPSGLLHRYCVDCHGADTAEANVRLDSIDLQSERQRVGDTLKKIFEVVRSGEMPPEDAELPSELERSQLVQWADEGLHRLADQSRRSGQWTRTRRLTVEEYNFTLQSLFGVDATFNQFLPADPISTTGFRNESKLLGLSSLQLEAYLDSARQAVNRYVRFDDEVPKRLQYHIELEDLFYSTADRYAGRQNAPQPIDRATFVAQRDNSSSSPPRYTDPLGPTPPGAHSAIEQLRPAIPKLHQQYIALPRRLAVGEMIVRVRAAGSADRDGRFPRLRVEAGITLGDGCSIDKRLLGEVDVKAPLDAPEAYEFRIRLEDVPTKGPRTDEDSFDRLSVFDMDQLFISNATCDDHAIFGLGRGGYSSPTEGSAAIAESLEQMKGQGACFLHLDCVDIEMHSGVGKSNHPYRWTVQHSATSGQSQDESSTFAAMLVRFMREAYRRPVSAQERRAKVELFEQLRGQGLGFNDCVRETLAAVLISPSFLFHEFSSPGHEAGSDDATPTAHELAARLAYFLSLSPPDATLRQCADDGSLTQPRVLRHEALRLLNDARCRRFLDSFCRQWLRLDRYKNVAVDREIYSSFDDDLADQSIRETLETFAYVFDSDASALELIDANYVIVNDRLAKHYGISGVLQGELERVELPASSVRGGLLTQASVLTMNSDGVDSHPVRRGVWLLERILDQPPPPPPPNVPELDVTDPDLRGLTLKQRIEKHREPSACQSCHQGIDPWGIALENFDATGRWRDKTVASEAGDPQSVPIDASTRLPSGESVRGAGDLKRHLREQQGKLFAKALVQHLVTYAIGRRPDHTERSEILKIEKSFAASGHRLRELVLAIVASELFQAPSG
ncbi:MAG: DUF1592 domain-containing protein [Planctomycetota bacterium]